MVSPINRFLLDQHPEKKISQNVGEICRLSEEALNTFASQRGALNPNFSVKVDSRTVFGLDPYISAGQSVYLPPLFFIDPKIIPFTGPDDEALKDDVKVQKFANDVAEYCNLTPQKVTWEDKMMLRLYLSAMKDVDKSGEAMGFVLLHELGHGVHKHSERKASYVKKLSTPKYLILNILTFGIFKRAALDLQSRHHEKEADSFASEKYAKGGRYLFQTVRKFKGDGFREKIAYQIFCLSTVHSHGTYAKREERMKHKISKISPMN